MNDVFNPRLLHWTWLVTCLICLAVPPVFAAEEPDVLDFESIGEDLPDWWVAVGTGNSGQLQNRRAREWTSPVKFVLVADEQREGTLCLLWEFTDDCALPVFVRPGHAFSGYGSRAKIQVEIRAENLSGPVFLSASEHLDEERVANHHQKVKFDVGPDWGDYSWELELNPQTDKIRISFSVEGQSGGTKIWVDNLRVTFFE